MAYSSAKFSVGSGWLKAQIQKLVDFGGSNISPVYSGPSLRELSYDLWSGSGSQLGKIDRMAFISGTLTSDTPGTTDTVDIDLSSLTDPAGDTVAMAKLVALVIVNYATADGSNLILGGTSAAPATNPWTAPFADMTTPANGRLRIPAGYTSNGQNQYNFAFLSGGGNTTALPVSGTSKNVRLYTAAASLPYGVIAVGRSA